MKQLAVGLMTLAAWYTLTVSAALPVEGGTTTKEGINVPTPADGGSAGTAKTRGPLSEVLRLKDGDMLHGNLALLEDGKMTWTRPDINAPIIMDLTNIQGIRLFKYTANEQSGTKVELKNGDVLYGDIVSMDEETFTLDTWYGGRLEMPKLMIQQIRPGSKSGPVILESIGNLADWPDQSGGGDWSAKSGALTCNGNGSIGRQLELPDAIHLQVTVSWKGSNPSFNIVTFTNSTNNFYNDCFNLRVSSSYVSLMAGRSDREFGNARVNKLKSLQIAKFDLFLDRKKQTAALMINNELIRKWENMNYNPGGNGIILNSGYTVTSFSKLRITEWDGKLPTPGAAGNTDKNADLVRFSNGDKMSGKIMNIKDGNVTLKTQFATMPVPTKNIASMTFNPADVEEARKRKGDINLFFPNGDKLTMELISLKDGKVTGKSENFGTRSFDIKAFIGIKFNIYGKKGDTKEDDGFYDLLFHE